MKTLLTLALLVEVSMVVTPFIFAQQEVVTPELKLTLVNPSTNPARLQWGEVIQYNLRGIGIACDRVIWDWDTIYDRILECPEDLIGKTYNEGGYDALFVGYAISPEMDLRTLFKGDPLYYSPGQNYYVYDNDALDALLDAAMLEPDYDEREAIQHQVLEILYDDQPSCIISYFVECVAYDPDLTNYDEGYWYPAWAYPEKWKGLTTCILAQTGPVLELNPFVSTSYYDLTATAVLYPALIRKDNMVNAQMEGILAEDWSVAEDGKTWTVTLKQDAFWDDGVQITADDVVFSYQAPFEPDLACPFAGDYTTIFGSKDNIKKIDNFTVEFALPQIYALFEPLFLDDPILPKHIFENIPYSDWRTDFTNTGIGTGDIVSGGPYSFVEFDTTTQTVKFTKNEDYINKDALEAAGYFTIEDYWVTFIESWEPAIAALKNGEVHFLDSQYHPEGHLNELDEGVAEGWCDYTLYSSNGYQELGFNCQHPVWGTGVETPLGKSNPSRAAEAARYLRQAVSHCIPRDQIIYGILDGIGIAGDQHAFPGQPERRDDLTPYEYNLTRAKELIQMAGYTFAPPAPSFIEQYGIYLAFGAGLVIAIAGTYFLRRK